MYLYSLQIKGDSKKKFIVLPLDVLYVACDAENLFKYPSTYITSWRYAIQRNENMYEILRSQI
jgi:hypothetical protein